MATPTSREEKLRKRFQIARLILDGNNGGEPWSPEQIKAAVGVSHRTHCRDVARARGALTFEEWMPKKRGPEPGKRRVGAEAISLALELVLERKQQKRNVARTARDLCHRAHAAGIGITLPTAKRIIRDIYRRDDPYLRAHEMGREGERLFNLQKGSFRSSAPLEVVFIDHTPLDAKSKLAGSWARPFRPTLTTASDLYSGALLAGFVSLFPPCRTTVALAMAMLTSDKTPLLRERGIPGEWECAGVPKRIMVDGAKEFSRAEFDWVCKRYDIDLDVGGGPPERRSPHERIFRTLNSEIHTWPATTLSNAAELKRYGGLKQIELDFEEIQRRMLIAMTEYNYETFDGYDLAPIVAWREAIGTVPEARRPARSTVSVFLDFLPSEERRLTRSGVEFMHCKYRGPELAALRHCRVGMVKFHFDPRDMRQIYIPVPDERQFVEIPRMEPAGAPCDLYLLRAYNSLLRQRAEDSRDKDLLAELHAIKRPGRYNYFEMLTSLEGDGPRGDRPMPTFGGKSREPAPARPAPALDAPSAEAEAPLEIPDFPSRIK